MKIDALDERIIDAFQHDGRQSNREVARRLGVSEGTVRQRLRKLQAMGAVHFDVVTSAAAVGIEYIAFVRASVAPRHLEAFLSACERIEHIWYLAAISGRFNAQALICTRDAAEAVDIVNGQMASLAGVHEVQIRQVVGQTKHDYLEMVVPRQQKPRQ